MLSSMAMLQERNTQEDPGGWACGRPDPQALQPTVSIENVDGDIAAAFPEEQPVCNRLYSPQFSSIQSS